MRSETGPRGPGGSRVAPRSLGGPASGELAPSSPGVVGAADLASVRAAAELTLPDGGGPARRRAAALDAALAELVDAVPVPRSALAVVAVGGYGRAEVSPHSDVDLLLLVEDRRRPGPEALRGLLYPLWDAGFQVGHAVCSPREAIERARGGLEAATSLLEARLIAGPFGLFEELAGRRRRWLDRDGRRLARRVLEATAERHLRVERAGWVLAPDLKQDAGGLRDLHALGWLCAVAGRSRPAGPPELLRAGELLLAVREALHGQSRRKLDRVRTDLQPAVAKALGLDGEDGVDRLMAAVHMTARTVEHLAGVEMRALAERLLGGPRRSGSARRLDPGGIRLEDGLLVADPAQASPGDQAEVLLAVRLLAARARTGRMVAGPTMTWLEGVFRRPTVEAWGPSLRAAFLAMLAGPSASAACELLDHLGGWTVLLPEWSAVRGRAQHDPWHRYTVDGHAFATVAEVTRLLDADPAARTAADPPGDLETLYLAALLHDVGKGSGEDHSVAGERLARRALRRMGVGPEVVDEVAALVRHHLLLVDTATRRDLDDPTVVGGVAATLGSPRRVRLLHLLTIADGLATGPVAWSHWKATLVADLARRVGDAMERGAPPGPGDPADLASRVEAARPALAGRTGRLLATLPASYPASVEPEELADELELLADPPGPGAVRYRVDTQGDGHGVVTVCAADRPGTLARTTGVLALHRVSVLRAQAWSTSDGLALQRFAVLAPGSLRWERLGADLEAAWAGRLAVEARLERKARDYRPSSPVVPDVRVLAEESAHSTVVEVRAPDALGLLHAIAAALGDLDLDVRVAKIDTRGDRVVDVFYVRSPWGAKLTDAQAAELTLAVRHRTARLLGG
jgi:[protein-PII] uridylyltransferase